ncbi:Zn-ribbon domain-containing OB-fold protein [Micromonospora sp. NPDC050686]|uniref:Zn-ribbon domain-containing OB-fold protein n=1 Tax=Micromonospora sp. NPDC050686 TaxID=3154631 RepID=UPI0033EDF0E9
MKPIAHPTPDTQAWFDLIDQGRLTVPRCLDCGDAFLYPRMCCPACGSRSVELAPASGRGVVDSFVVNHRGPAAFAGEVPYVLALVRLEEGPRMTANVIVDDPARVRVDLPVAVTFEQRGARRVVQFVPAEVA